MFDTIADRYDLMNRVMTLGQDQRWRRWVTELAGPVNDGWILDLASGTGDIAALLRKRYPEARVIGGDFSANMLGRARSRFGDTEISWQVCDANTLPFGSGTFTAVTFGYLLRNVDDAMTVLREVHRVLRPGGKIVCLDTTPPEKTWSYPLVRAYFRFGIPVLGRLLAKDESAYAYLTGSTMDFHDAGALAGMFEDAGFCQVGYRKFMLNTIGIHWGVKP